MTIVDYSNSKHTYWEMLKDSQQLWECILIDKSRGRKLLKARTFIEDAVDEFMLSWLVWNVNICTMLFFEGGLNWFGYNGYPIPDDLNGWLSEDKALLVIHGVRGRICLSMKDIWRCILGKVLADPALLEPICSGYEMCRTCLRNKFIACFGRDAIGKVEPWEMSFEDWKNRSEESEDFDDNVDG